MATKPDPKKKTKAATTTARSAAPAATRGSSHEADLRKLDQEIQRLINKRADLTLKMIEASPDKRSLLFNPRGDDDLVVSLAEANGGPLTAADLRNVYVQILSAIRGKVRTHRVAYLGPAYSFTHMAAIERFGKSAELIPVNTISAVFEEVNRGHADFGMAPIENSTDGRIVDTLEMFTRLPLRVCGEVLLSVHHNLMSRTPRSEVTEVYSKPQALSQCRDWLSRNMPQAKLVDVSSTSTAAQLARDKHGAAAIASKQAATEYGLEILASNIEDNKNNVTRFAVIGERTMEPTGRDRTSLLLQIPHKPGSLSDALMTFKTNKINLTWIESFPLRGPESGYIFFLDLEGHAKEAKIKRTLEELARQAVRLEVLGSYPRSEAFD